MQPLPFVWPVGLFFWAVVLWAFSPELLVVRRAREDAARPSSVDRGSCRIIIVGMGIASLIAFPLAWVPAVRAPEGWQVALLVLGMGALIGGSLLRRHCFRMLGASFTGDVRAAPDQAIVTTGAYALVRHPSYTAGILMNAGIGMALGSWGSLAVLLLASGAVYGYRMAIEERALLAAVGEPYREFMRSRRRLIPFIY